MTLTMLALTSANVIGLTMFTACKYLRKAVNQSSGSMPHSSASHTR